MNASPLWSFIDLGIKENHRRTCFLAACFIIGHAEWRVTAGISRHSPGLPFDGTDCGPAVPSHSTCAQAPFRETREGGADDLWVAPPFAIKRSTLKDCRLNVSDGEKLADGSHYRANRDPLSIARPAA
jgi:hypothetical protein